MSRFDLKTIELARKAGEQDEATANTSVHDVMAFTQSQLGVALFVYPWLTCSIEIKTIIKLMMNVFQF